MNEQDLKALRARVLRGGEAKYHEKNAQAGKLFVRERISRLVDPASFVEEGGLANATDSSLPADGVVTGLAQIGGRPAVIIANDSTVKAGSWGRLTVEKILRAQESARRLRCPLCYLIDSAGARIPDQLQMFPGRRGAGRIFHHQVQLSGVIPQICLLFGPSAAGGAYIPAFCDVVVMVAKNASMYLGSPRMAEMVIGEKVSLEEMGGAKMHTTVSGCGDVLVKSEPEAIEWARDYLAYMPLSCAQAAPTAPASAVKAGLKPLREIIVADENKPFDMHGVIDHVIDAGTLLEIKPKFAREVITALARIDGRTVGIVANQPKHLGGVLFVDSADKAARFVQLCDSFNIPLVFLADVPGFMIGSKVEKQGIIRAGAKMVAAVSMASVPKISVIVRKAYGAGLYAMCGPAFEPDVCLALPTASVAVMGPQAAVNAVYYHRIQAAPAGPEREQLIQQLREAYRADIDLEKIAAELIVDDVIDFEDLRPQLSSRLEFYSQHLTPHPQRKHLVMPM